MQDDTGHAREVGLQDRKEELYMVRIEVQGFEGLVVEGMQQLLRRKQVGCYPAFRRHSKGLCSLPMLLVVEGMQQRLLECEQPLDLL